MFALGTPIFANDVRITQQLLTKLGYNPGPIDGSYGDKTKRALENFYAAQNKKFDGELSSNEINALEAVFAKRIIVQINLLSKVQLMLIKTLSRKMTPVIL
jgi:peptidoglycan hydrolase-like protein with peptidoglycan-binding domain